MNFAKFPSIIQVPPSKDKTPDAVVSKKYKHWRWRMFIGMYIGYTIFYFTRKNISPVDEMKTRIVGALVVAYQEINNRKISTKANPNFPEKAKNTLHFLLFKQELFTEAYEKGKEITRGVASKPVDIF